MNRNDRGRRIAALMLLLGAVAMSALPLATVAKDGGPRAAGPAVAREPRIVNGDPVKPGAMPWMVYLEFINEESATVSCSGTLIRPTAVLTAAHCVDRAVEGVAVIGSADLNDPSSGRRVPLTAAHPSPWFQGWASGIIGNDVAVVLLSQPVDDVRPIRLAATRSPRGRAPGTVATVAGWGRTETNGEISPILLQTTLPVLPQRDCAEAYSLDPLTVWSVICAGGVDHGVCYGDSGGPLFVRKGKKVVQVGISSFLTPERCANPGYPSGFTRISAPSVRKFIDDVLAGTRTDGVIRLAPPGP